jgi:hypothetical protein
MEADHYWLPQQLSAGRAMLLANPRKTALAIHTSAGLRPVVWHGHPWFRWTHAAEPFLAAFLADGTVVDVGRANPIVLNQAALMSIAA